MSLVNVICAATQSELLLFYFFARVKFICAATQLFDNPGFRMNICYKPTAVQTSTTPLIWNDTRALCSPRQVVVDDIKALLADRPLPYQGFDMFEGEDHNVKGHVLIQG